jgi:hypothetical protein
MEARLDAMRWVMVVVSAAVTVGVAAVLVAQRTWRTTVDALHREVTTGSERTTRISPESVPEPVARYLSRAVPPSAPEIEGARLQQTGTFQMGEGEEGWRAFTAQEVFRVNPPAFYWDARISVAPGLSAFVRDFYASGAAGMTGKVGGLVTVVNEAASPQLASGALARFLAEAVWFPTRLAVGPGLSWSPVDDDRATATLVDGDLSVSLTFTFDAQGDPVRVEGVRARATEAGFVETPWIGVFSDYGEVGGFRIPRYGEVAWVVDGKLVLYWRGSIRSAEYS